MLFSRRFVSPLAFLCLASAAFAADDSKIPEPARAVLDRATQFVVYSLEPSQSEGGNLPDGFHGWKVLGKTVVKDAEARKQVVSALARGVEENDGSKPDCFEPRHGIRAVQDGKTLDLVICFQCLQVKAYVGEKADRGFLTKGSPQPVFDKVLKDAGVPLAKKQGE